MIDKLPRVLFVDDEPGVLDGFRRHFYKQYDVATAVSGDEALRLLDGNQFAVIISDQCMPDMDGIRLLAEIRRRQPLAMRVLLTGVADQPVAVRAINEGQVFAFLNKPVTLEALRATIERAIDTWKMRKYEQSFMDKKLGDIALL